MPDPKRECERLLNALLPFADQMLEERGVVTPFGGFLDEEGEMYHVGVKDQMEPVPLVVSALRESVRQIAAEQSCSALGIVSDVVTRVPQLDWMCEALHFSLDHATGYSVEVFMPYKLVEREVVYGDVFSRMGNHDLFH